MSLYKGTTPIAGLAVNKIMAGRFLLEAIWSDHIINDIQYLRADTFSWQSGIVYTAAYNKLVEEYTSGTEETKDGITFRRSENGFKIADASQEDAIASKYTDTGVAWYYILDTENKQFKLPRTKFNFVGLRDNAGDYVSESLPNINASWQRQSNRNVLGPNDILTGAFKRSSSESNYLTFGDSGSAYKGGPLEFDASHSSSTYQNNAPVQQRATQMYLYFFVGNFSQTAIEQTAGLKAELFNNKMDRDLSNKPSNIHFVTETYVKGTSGYRLYSDKYIEQWGYKKGTTSETTTFLKAFKDTNYNVVMATEHGSVYFQGCYTNKTATSMKIDYTGGSGGSATGTSWMVTGYIA